MNHIHAFGKYLLGFGITPHDLYLITDAGKPLPLRHSVHVGDSIDIFSAFLGTQIPDIKLPEHRCRA